MVTPERINSVLPAHPVPQALEPSGEWDGIAGFCPQLQGSASECLRAGFIESIILEQGLASFLWEGPDNK